MVLVPHYGAPTCGHEQRRDERGDVGRAPGPIAEVHDVRDERHAPAPVITQPQDGGPPVPEPQQRVLRDGREGVALVDVDRAAPEASPRVAFTRDAARAQVIRDWW